MATGNGTFNVAWTVGDERILVSPEKDLRRYAQDTQRRLFIGVLLLLFLIGDGLIFLFYGERAGILALICTLVGLSPLVLIFISMVFFGWLARKGMDD